MDRAKLKGYGALVLVFALGMLAGGAGSRAMLQRRYARLFKDPSAVFEHRRLGALSRRLDLDGAQNDQVRTIMNKYAAERRTLTREVMDRCGTPLREQKVRMDTEIRALLRPDQRARYEELQKGHEGRHPPDGPLEPLP
jgi:Spy/CpxP family protein refolding chaperone